MSAFDPSTAYACDYEFLDFTEDARLYPMADNATDRLVYMAVKVRREDLSDPYTAAISSQLLDIPRATGFTVWKKSTQPVEGESLTPEQGDTVRLGVNGDGTQYLLKAVTQSRFGCWIVGAVEKLTDG